MGLHRRSIRLRTFLLVFIPILSLIGLYAFAVSITASDAINLARSKTVKNTIGLPTGQLEAQIDAERLLAVLYLASPTPPTLAALQAQEGKTSNARLAFSRAVASSATMGSASPQEKQAFSALLSSTAGLGTLRSAISSLTISRPQALTGYSSMIAAAGVVLNQVILQQTNVPLVTQGLAFVAMGKSEEMLLQEDALITGDMAARSFHAADRQEFTQLVGARRAIYAQTLPELDPIYRVYYQQDVSPQASAALVTLEDNVISDPRPSGIPPVSPTSWAKAVRAVSAGLSRAGEQSANELTIRAQPVANATYLRLILAGGLGLVAIILSIIVAVWIGRGIVRQLADLRQSALELAHNRLPGLVQRLRAGEEVDVSVEAPQLEPGSDEIGQVREAFNAVQRTAVEAAVDEARVRRGISDVFRNLARRSQSLLHRQLALLDAMERRATEPGELEDLFRIDHLTTRMRRHSEGLIILSGESPGRGWRNPVPFADVLRAAVAEVEDYTRIRVTTGTPAALVGAAVADVIHLIAELAENAAIFSPPNTPVRMHGDTVGRGFAVEIEDRGLGIPDEELAEINHNLAHPPPFDLSGSEQLGLFIAGQLARRHNIQISLRPSPYGGTTAIVLIPQALVVDDGSYHLEPGSAADRAIRLTGRPGALHQGTGTEPPAPAQPNGPALPTVQPSALAAGAPPEPLGEPSAVPAGDPWPGGTADPSPARATDPSSPWDREPSPVGGAADPSPAPFDPWVIPAGRATAPSGPHPGPDNEFTAVSPADTAATGGGSPEFRRHQPLDGADDPAEMDSRVSTTDLTELGLPVRVRQASLAPQLRGGGAFAAAAADSVPSAPSPEAARSTVSALQRGWERGRYESAAPDPGPGAALSPEPGIADGTELSDD
jgi:signal transduction histidine kinase